MAIDRKSRKSLACAGKRPALSAASRLPYRCRSVAAPVAPTPGAPGSLSDGIAAQGDEIRNLRWFDTVPGADLCRVDARHLTSADGIKDGGAIRGKLKRVAIAACNENATAAFFFGRAPRQRESHRPRSPAPLHSESRMQLQILA